jgi:hypothetical protein
VIPTRQALRALRTWSRPERLGSQRVSRQLARELLVSFPPRSHAALFHPLASALECGCPLGLDGFEVPHEEPPHPDRERVEAAIAEDFALVAQVSGREQRLLQQGAREHAHEYTARYPHLLAPEEDLTTVRIVSPQALAALAAVTRALADLSSVGFPMLEKARDRVQLRVRGHACLALLIAVGRDMKSNRRWS